MDQRGVRGLGYLDVGLEDVDRGLALVGLYLAPELVRAYRDSDVVRVHAHRDGSLHRLGSARCEVERRAHEAQYVVVDLDVLYQAVTGILHQVLVGHQVAGVYHRGVRRLGELQPRVDDVHRCLALVGLDRVPELVCAGGGADVIGVHAHSDRLLDCLGLTHIQVERSTDRAQLVIGHLDARYLAVAGVLHQVFVGDVRARIDHRRVRGLSDLEAGIDDVNRGLALI